MFEHLGISLSTGKNYTFDPKNNNNNNNNNYNTAVLNHTNYNNCNATGDDFRVIGSSGNDSF